MAVKTLSSRDPEMVAKFMDEAELMKRFSHPNIVSLLGIYIVHVQSGSLDYYGADTCTIKLINA